MSGGTAISSRDSTEGATHIVIGEKVCVPAPATERTQRMLGVMVVQVILQLGHESPG
jgi:hypothetical protein